MLRPIVKESDSFIKASRESACTQVLSHFDLESAEDLLCFLDEVDFEPWKKGESKSNRGGFMANLGGTLAQGVHPVPPDAKRLYNESLWTPRPYASLVYLHGSTCQIQESLIITLAHELRHYMQYSQAREFYMADQLLLQVQGYTPDLPSESDALAKSKRVATCLCGKDRVEHYAIQQRIEASEDGARSRWDYFLSLSLDEDRTFAEKTQVKCQQSYFLLEAQIAKYSTQDRIYFQDILSFVLAWNSTKGDQSPSQGS
jgi:hypothetical protein